MGPRIILRGAIPTNSNIGGSGHRPLLLRGSVTWFLLVVFLPWVVRVLVVSLVLKVSLQRPLFVCLRFSVSVRVKVPCKDFVLPFMKLASS